MREQEILYMSFCKTLLVPKSDTGPKWPSYKLGSAGELAS